MVSNQTNYTAEFFKKERMSSDSSDNLEDAREPEVAEDESSEISSDDDVEIEFNNEDRLISRLYREAVDEVMSRNNLRERDVDSAIKEMKQEIRQGHRRGFRRFKGINFSLPENCCGYLRRYAICHTGLVKKIVWDFLTRKGKSLISREEFTKENHLKVVSLGGGPGNDLVGFCCALQEINNSIKELDLYIVDVCKGWKNVFPVIIRKAILSDFGRFSLFLKKTKINAGFIETDLTEDSVFEKEPLFSTLGEADIVLMVKLTSFLPDEEAGVVLHNVVDCMKSEAMLIFIDQPYDKAFFEKILNLKFIYHDNVKYELSFNPAKYRSPSIDETHAHVAIYQKEFCSDEDS